MVAGVKNQIGWVPGVHGWCEQLKLGNMVAGVGGIDW